MNQYVKNFNRLADALEKRAAFLNRHPRLEQIVDQLSIRAKVLAIKTIRVEATSLRSILDNAQVHGTVIDFGDGVRPREWFSAFNPADLPGLRANAHRLLTQIIDDGDEVIARDMASLGGAEDVMSREEIVDILAGRSQVQAARPSQKDQRYLGRRDLDRMEMDLADRDRLLAVYSVDRPDVETDIRGLLRLFMSTIWLTGMRPTELWACRLYVPNADIVFTDELREMIRTRPAEAIENNLLMLVETSAELNNEPLVDREAWHATIRTGAPCVMMILSAKQANANEMTSPIRLQVLEGISSEDLAPLAIASQLRFTRTNAKRHDSLHGSMNRTLEKLAAGHPNLRGMLVNLYSFRHSFVTRVKLSCDPPEAAALIGHTSRKSMSAYGERNVSKGSGARRLDGWIPAPDPARAAALDGYWRSLRTPAAPGLQAQMATPAR